MNIPTAKESIVLQIKQAEAYTEELAERNEIAGNTLMKIAEDITELLLKHNWFFNDVLTVEVDVSDVTKDIASEVDNMLKAIVIIYETLGYKVNALDSFHTIIITLELK